jgi:hypothetical protein
MKRDILYIVLVLLVIVAGFSNKSKDMHKRIWVVADYVMMDGGYHILLYTVNPMVDVTVSKEDNGGKFYKRIWVDDPKGGLEVRESFFYGSKNICRVNEMDSVYVKSENKQK